jgi:UDP-N-acetyl-D-mannosaminuronic acid dehydrogenase
MRRYKMNLVVFGLGRIGLPIALVCAESGYRVVGIDVNKDLIESLHQGSLAFDEPGMEDLLKKHLRTSFFPKHPEEDIHSDLQKTEYIMIAVGTGFARYPERPKLSTLYSIIGQLIAVGLKGKTLILRVTLPIGTSDNIVELIEKKTGLHEGKDFWFSFVPERIMEGKAITEERSLPKIIGCYNDEGFERVSSVFKHIGGDLLRVSNPRTAEFIKLIDNSWRSTRFAFANELAYLAETQGIDVIEAITAANKKYDRNAIPSPGPVSGYCLGKDPYLLELGFSEIKKRRGFGSVWFTGRRANDWLAEKILEEVRGENILVAGLSFKENIDDYRYSHAIDIIRKLLEEDYKIIVSDPFLDKNYYTRLPEDIANKVKKYKSIEKALNEKIDTIIITTRHDEYRKTKTKNLLNTITHNVKIIDLWNIYKDTFEKNKNIEYKGFGRG